MGEEVTCPGCKETFEPDTVTEWEKHLDRCVRSSTPKRAAWSVSKLLFNTGNRAKRILLIMMSVGSLLFVIVFFSAIIGSLIIPYLGIVVLALRECFMYWKEWTFESYHHSWDDGIVFQSDKSIQWSGVLVLICSSYFFYYSMTTYILPAIVPIFLVVLL